jgi:hypothetical protein
MPMQVSGGPDPEGTTPLCRFDFRRSGLTIRTSEAAKRGMIRGVLLCTGYSTASAKKSPLLMLIGQQSLRLMLTDHVTWHSCSGIKRGLVICRALWDVLQNLGVLANFIFI